MSAVSQQDQSSFDAASNAKQFHNVSNFRDRHKKLRWRYRKDGLSVSLGTEYGSAEFILRYNAAVNGQTVQGVPTRFQNGILSQVIDRWYRSTHFTALSKSTQEIYRRQAEGLRCGYGRVMVSAVQGQQIKEMLAAKAHVPNAANHDLRILRFLMDEAVEMGLIRHNVARDVKRLPVLTGGYHVWTEDEIAAFYAVHRPGSVAYTCMTLMLYTGAARGDAAGMGRENVRDGRIRYIRKATKARAGVVVDIPIHSVLAACIALVPPEFEFFLQTAQGTAPAAGTVGNYMREWCDAAGLRQCTSHGLRKACERRLGEAGMKEQEIASVLGFVDTTTPHMRLGMGVRSELADSAISTLP